MHMRVIKFATLNKYFHLKTFIKNQNMDAFSAQSK